MSTQTSAMQINIPSVTAKKASLIRDAIRIIAWEQFKLDYKQELRDSQLPFGGYELFSEAWQQTDFINMNLEELIKFIEGLGYTANSILNYRSQHYANKSNYKQSQNQSGQAQAQASLPPAQSPESAEQPALPAGFDTEEF